MPGRLKSQSVRGAVRFDEARQDGLSGKAKKAMGWEDADISLAMELLTDDDSDCYEKLARINAVFKAYDAGANPLVYTVTNRHLRARGVDQVAFSGLESSESDADDVIMCTLTFVEHIPAIAQPEQQASAQGAAAPQATAGSAEPALDPSISVEVE